MFKRFKVTCKDCKWIGEREEQDLFAPCPICGSGNIQVDDFERPSEKEISLQKIMEKDLIIQMKENIVRMGKNSIWNTLNGLTIETRISYINFYIEALQDLKEEGNLGDNFPNIGEK